jgi:hypothetical protein
MARGTDTYIYTVGASPNTRVALSQKNRVLSTPYSSTTVQRKQIGVLSTFDYTESRAVDPVRGVGMGDKISELVPGVTEPMGMTLNRTMLYTAGIVQELGYKGGVDGIVRSLRAHKWPFDIQSELVFSELVANVDKSQYTGGLGVATASDGVSIAVITYFVACWLESYSVSFPSDSAIVVEDAGAKATDVTDGIHGYGATSSDYGDLLDSGNNPFVQPGVGSKLYNGA